THRRHAPPLPDALPILIAALEHRLEQIAAAARAVEYAIEDIPNQSGTPDTVTEHYRLGQARLDGEGIWIRQLLGRLRTGEYWFSSEGHTSELQSPYDPF